MRPHRLVAAAVDEVGAEHALAVAEEHVVAVPFVDAEVGVEAVRHGVPGHLPAHPRLQARDVRLRRARGVREGGVAGVQMGQVGDLIGPQGAAAAGVVGPAEHPGLEEGAIDDQLAAALEQVEQAHLALGPVELILLFDGHPRHPPAFGGQRVTGAGQGLLLHEQLLARTPPTLAATRSGVYSLRAVRLFRSFSADTILVMRSSVCEMAGHADRCSARASTGGSDKCGGIRWTR